MRGIALVIQLKQCCTVLTVEIGLIQFWEDYFFLRTVCRFDFYTVRREHNLALLSNVCEAAPISLFWAPNGVNELPEMRFAFPLVLTGQGAMAFLTGQSWRVHNYVGPEHGFRCFIAD